MKLHITVGVVAALTVAVGTAGDALKSGPNVGEAIYNKDRGPFHPLNCNGAKAGVKNCLV
jgi:hypothetical protein